MSIVRLAADQFQHVHDRNSNVTRLVTGPRTLSLQDHQEAVFDAPQALIVVPPMHAATVHNPVRRGPDGAVLAARCGQVLVAAGDREVRLAQPPFSLYPGEQLDPAGVVPLTVLSPYEAVLLEAVAPLEDDGSGAAREAGERWMFKGPATLVPRADVDVVESIAATVVPAGSGVHLRARMAFTDRSGVSRCIGDEWMHTAPGAFLPDAEELVAGLVTPTIITEDVALHLRALVAHTDQRGTPRRPGEEWMVTAAEEPMLLVLPQQEVASRQQRIALGPRQAALIENPLGADGLPMAGHQALRHGPCAFFLRPGEALVELRDALMLSARQAVVLTAMAPLTDADGVERKPGDRWMVRGPRVLQPPVGVTVVERRSIIPLDANEGVYIRDLNTGAVRAHIGSSVMLGVDEELVAKTLSPIVEELLATPQLTKGARFDSTMRSRVGRRDPWAVVTCNVPHNSVVQVYNFALGHARIVVGPKLVLLDYEEEFTVLRLSGGRPKIEGQLVTLALFTGPDFMTDAIFVETKDHTRLSLQLSYNWHFDTTAPDYAARLFTIPDFVGTACKAIASRVRGAVAAVPFDAFHRNSAMLIRQAVFADPGAVLEDAEGAVSGTGQLQFANGLRVTSVDVQGVDPMDPKTQQALTKSVQLAIEIATKSQEAAARHLATSTEQTARGKMEKAVLGDKALAEVVRRRLLEIEAENAAIEGTGVSIAQARAQGESLRIAGETEVALASQRALADQVMLAAEVTVLREKQGAEIDFMIASDELEIDKHRQLSEVEAWQFEQMVAAVGNDTIRALAKSGPELQAKLLKALGLQGYLVTDGSSPINLFNTAKGLAATAARSA